MNIQWLAHAAEFHGDETPDLTHLLTEWWVSLALYAVLLAFIYWGTSKYWTMPTRLSVILAVSLVIGLVFYRWTPLLSAAAITLGFACSLVLALGGAKSD